jgi:fungal STAND N-terminal Goodbye domain/NACHT domain
MSIWSDQADQIWRDAIRHYEDITGNSLESPDLTNIHSVDELQRRIESESQNAVAFRQKRAKLVKLLRGVLVPVELITNIASGGLDNSIGPAALVFNAARYLIRAARDVSRRLDTIEEVLDKMQHFAVRFAVYTGQTISPELQKTLTEVVTVMLEIFALCTKAIKLGRVLTFGRNALFNEDKKIQDAINKLDRLTRGEDQLIGAETHSLVYRQAGMVGEVASNTMAVLEEVRNGRKENQELHKNVIKAMQIGETKPYDTQLGSQQRFYHILLPTPNPQDIYEKIAKERLPGTAEWIHKEDFFRTWIKRSIPVLWISGMPGAGKSFLSCSIVSYLYEHHNPGVQSSFQASIGYFFFKDNDPETRSVHHALRDVAYQICLNDPVYARHVTRVCETPNDIKTIESAWRKLFLQFFVESDERGRSVYIILDGIDEAFESDRIRLF